VCLLFRHYKRAYQELFLPNDGKCSDSSSESNNQEVSDYYRFGWLLFLVLRIQTFSRFKDLVTSTNELVSVLVRTSAMIFASVFSSFAARQLMYTVS
jgi:retinoblastoma-like protein 1